MHIIATLFNRCQHAAPTWRMLQPVSAKAINAHLQFSVEKMKNAQFFSNVLQFLIELCCEIDITYISFAKLHYINSPHKNFNLLAFSHSNIVTNQYDIIFSERERKKLNVGHKTILQIGSI